MLLILVFTFSLLNVYLQLEPRRTGTNIITTHQHQNERELFFSFFCISFFLIQHMIINCVHLDNTRMITAQELDDDAVVRLLVLKFFFSFASFLLIRSLNSIGQLQHYPSRSQTWWGGFSVTSQFFILIFFTFFN